MGRTTCQFIFAIFVLVSFSVSPCDAKLQIARCCPENHRIRMITNNENPHDKECVKVKVNGTITDFSDFKVYTKNLELTNKSVKDLFEVVDANKMRIVVNETEDYTWAMENSNKTIYLTEEAMLYTVNRNEYNTYDKIASHEFCLGYTPIRRGVFKLGYFTMPIKPKDVGWQGYLRIVSPLVSSLFLAIVLAVYALLKRLRKGHGQIFMSYVFNLLIAFLLLAVINLSNLHGSITREFCVNATLSFYFFMLASFFWMNVMSFDLWQTFRGMVRVGIARHGKLKHAELRKYCVYCAYAWGIPLLITLAVWQLDRTDLTSSPNFIKPNIGLHKCFFDDGERFLYLYVPMVILLLCNTVFFFLTVRNMSLGSSAMLHRKDSGSSRRFRFVLYVKLSAVMGINWLLEVIGSFFPDETMIVADLYNGLTGVIIFFLYVCKKKTLQQLQMRSFNSSRRSRNNSDSSESTLSSTELRQTSLDPRGPRD